MKLIKRTLGDLFLPKRFFRGLGSCVLLFIGSFFFPFLFGFSMVWLSVFLVLVLADYLFLFLNGSSPVVKRVMGDRLSNGDDNLIYLLLRNRMNFPVNVEIIDELPEQFQWRDFCLKKYLKAGEEQRIAFKITPRQRGLYHFGDTHLFVNSGLGLITRRFTSNTSREVSVFPSYMQLKRYQLVSRTEMLHEHGSKRMRKIGQSMEFEQIRDYVTGDDIRTLNWKATARKGQLMVNHFANEKSQQVFCIIDKGRLMKMPFAGLTLLDYAINSTLVMSNICLQKQDKIGLITFSDKLGTVVAADRKPIQREKMMEALYRLQTSFLESDYEMLYQQIRRRIKQRSLLILYTNFESLNGLRRQVNYLRSIAKHHLLLVVFFENTELVKLSHSTALTIEDIYIKTAADKFVFEKKLIVKELLKYGILSILTSPENLTINTVNKYLELKSKQAL